MLVWHGLQAVTVAATSNVIHDDFLAISCKWRGMMRMVYNTCVQRKYHFAQLLIFWTFFFRESTRIVHQNRARSSTTFPARASEEASIAELPLERCLGVPIPEALEEDGPVRQTRARMADQHWEAATLRDRCAYPH